jgi:hypothetical protein
MKSKRKVVRFAGDVKKIIYIVPAASNRQVLGSVSGENLCASACQQHTGEQRKGDTRTLPSAEFFVEKQDAQNDGHQRIER